MKLRATILGTGQSAAGIEIPAAVVESLGGGKRPKVKATLNGSYTYRSSIAPMGGTFMLGVSSDVRREAGVAAGDDVDLELTLDKEPRVVDVPADFAAALDSSPEARRAFDALNYSNRYRYVYAINQIKSAEARARRIAKSVEELSRGPAPQP
jgi:hypothetical protein